MAETPQLIGRTISHYHILEKLGAGGMGVVYKAEDTRLGRYVALKFLPEDISQDSQMIERFRREARTASSLNHPSICTIYDIGNFEARPFIAMELLEGQTLNHRISKKSLGVADVLDIGIQIADGLEAAHAKGILHRDIKPANIFLVDRGPAKILDFGVAKLTAYRQPATNAIGESSISTQIHFLDEELLLTTPGSSVGTVCYMSPEQARGEELDARSDLFSLGVLLYEMATGVLPFSGPSAALVFDSILHSSPTPATRVNPTLPAALENVLAKALEKDAELRYATATELRSDLKRVRRDLDSGRAVAETTSSPLSWKIAAKHPEVNSDTVVVAGLVRRHKKAIAAWISGAILACLVLVFVLYRTLFRMPAPPAGLEFSRVTGSGDVQQADISPDGRYVAYVQQRAGMQTVWLKQLATDSAVQIATVGGDVCPGVAFSPDGSYVYFVRQQRQAYSGDLYQVPALGGSPRKMLGGVSGPPAFSPDGQRIAFLRNSPDGAILLSAALDGSAERMLASFKPPEQIYPLRVAWSPDGTLAFTRVNPLWILTTMQGEGGPLESHAQAHWSFIRDFAWVPTSRNLVLAGVLQGAPKSSPEQLYEVSREGDKTRQITHDLSTYAAVRTSADGKALLALQDQVLSTVQVVTPGKESEARSLSTGNENRDGYIGVAWTPKGRIVYRSVSNGSADLWEIEPDGSGPHRLTNNTTSWAAMEPAVSPRGGFMAFTREDSSRNANIWRADMDGGNVKQLTEGEDDFRPAVSPDGLWVVFSRRQGSKSVLMKVPSGGGPVSALTDYNSYFPSISPDGKWIACWYFPDPNQPRALAIVPFAGGLPAKVLPVPDTSGGDVHWTPDGHAVAFLNRVNSAVNVWEQPVAGGPPKPVTHFTSDIIFFFDWFQDGRLVLSRGTERIDAVLIKNFL
ncbi:MAG TPA: protein kinase [Candidatus Angelobacter sp.]|nr:protein kinase [Candidatus Angelobacter sp.]